MATTVSFNGISYSVPGYNDSGWAQGTGNLSSYLIAIAAGAVTPTTRATQTQTFTGQTSVTVTHNLGYYPIVQVLDNSNNLILPDTLNHASVNAFTVTFSPSATGKILWV